jgi:hypothetical protein
MCGGVAYEGLCGQGEAKHDLSGTKIRTDYPDLDEANWRGFVNSRYDPQMRQWQVFTRPYIQVFT